MGEFISKIKESIDSMLFNKMNKTLACVQHYKLDPYQVECFNKRIQLL